MNDEKKHHIIITGTGRSGTTFLVKLLTRLGFDTGFDMNNFTVNGNIAYSEECNAGLEYQGLGGNLPYIIKNPKLMWQLPDLLRDNPVIIDHIIIPIRDIYAASESRRENVRKASKIIDPRMVPGGLEGVTEPSEQEGFFLKKYYEFSNFVSRYNIPITLIHYPRLIMDSHYLHNKLNRIFPGINYQKFCDEYNKIVNPNLIHKYNESDSFDENFYDESYNNSQSELSGTSLENVELWNVKEKLLHAEKVLSNVFKFRKNKEVNVELFYTDTEQFVQENCVEKHISVTDNKVTFKFDRPKKITGLRFDPCAEETVVCINYVIAKTNGESSTIDIKSTNCDYVQGDKQKIFYFLKPDPQIEFIFSGLVDSITIYLSYLAVGKYESYDLAFPLIKQDENINKQKEIELNELRENLNNTRGRLDKAIKEFMDVVKDKDHELKKKNEEIEAKNKKIIQLKEVINKKNAQLVQKDNIIQEKDNIIKAKEEKLVEKDNIINEKMSNIDLLKEKVENHIQYTINKAREKNKNKYIVLFPFRIIKSLINLLKDPKEFIRIQRHCKIIRRSKTFDYIFYIDQLNTDKIHEYNAIKHYVIHGWKMGVIPNKSEGYDRSLQKNYALLQNIYIKYLNKCRQGGQ